MGTLNMNVDERLLYLRESVEMLNNLGTACKYYSRADNVSELNSDPVITLNDPIDISILFEEEPKVIMDKFHWLSEDDDLPFVAYFPLIDGNDQLIKMTKYSVVEVPYDLLEDGTRKLQISEVRGDKVWPLLWVCKLVPYREWVDVKPETPEVDTTLGGNSDYQFTLLNVEKGD